LVAAQDTPPTEKDPAKKAPAKKAPAKKAPTKKKPAEKKPAAPVKRPPAGFEELNRRWEAIENEFRQIDSQYSTALPSKRRELLKQYQDLLSEGNELLPKLFKAAQEAYRKAPNKDHLVTRVLVGFIANDVRKDRYQAALDKAKPLLDNKCDEESLYDFIGQAAYALNDFAAAEKYLETAKKMGNGISSDAGGQFLADAPLAAKLWKLEQDIRKKEAAKKDLPRVKLETNQGDIVLELFENEAPQTVGNFIHLVEKNFYDGLTFHRVLPNFMAQGGCPNGDGLGGPGYKILCECYTENHRNHFRGSLSMAKSSRDTGGSQFFLTFRRTYNLDGKHTVFGRVVEGLDVLEKIQRRDPSNSPPLPKPDKIIKASVISKRDHSYEPTKAPEM